MMPFWKSLRKKGFLTEEKYNRLTRMSAFTDEEKAAFIGRQLVETSQGTKAITQILNRHLQIQRLYFQKQV